MPNGNAGGRLHIVNVDRAVTIGDAVMDGGDILVAGQPVPLDMKLAEDVTLPAGSVRDLTFAKGLP